MVRPATYLFVFSSLAFIKLVKSSGCTCKTTTSTDDVIENYILTNHVIHSLKVFDVGGCFHHCIHDNRCKSFNIGKENEGWMCELNESNKALSPGSFQERQGKTYYEVNNRLPSEPSYFKDCSCNYYIESTCECSEGYVGTHCHIKTSSCQDYLRFKRTYRSGIYSIFDNNDVLFPVYCDMDHVKMAAWTAVLSYALKYNSLFQKSPFYLDNPINQSAPNWPLYRLSLARMESIRGTSRDWRVSCNYSTHGIDGRDYAMANWADIDLLSLNSGGCQRFSYIDVRGTHCSNCTTWVHQGLKGPRMFLVSVPYGVVKGCDLNAPPNSNLHDESFGYYSNPNTNFRCTTNIKSTTQFWFGGSID